MGLNDVYYAKWKFHDANTGKDYTPGIHVYQNSLSFSSSNLGDTLREFWGVAHGITGGFKAWYPNEISLTDVLIRRVKPLEAVETDITTGLPAAGTNTGAAMDPGTSILVNQRTASIGRSYRGRTFFPAPAIGIDGDDGLIGASDASDLAEQFDWMRTHLIAVDLPMVVWSPLLDSSSVVTSIRVDRRFRSQRKRQVKLGDYVSP